MGGLSASSSRFPRNSALLGGSIFLGIHLPRLFLNNIWGRVQDKKVEPVGRWGGEGDAGQRPDMGQSGAPLWESTLPIDQNLSRRVDQTDRRPAAPQG